MMENGPFSEIWAKYQERFDGLAREMSDEAREWVEQNSDLLTEQAQYMKQVDLPESSNSTQAMRVEFDFDGIRKSGPGYSVGHAGKRTVDILLPFVTFKPNDDMLDKV